MAKRSGKAVIKFPNGKEVESTPKTQAEAVKVADEMRKKQEAEDKAAAKKKAAEASNKEA